MWRQEAWWRWCSVTVRLRYSFDHLKKAFFLLLCVFFSFTGPPPHSSTILLFLPHTSLLLFTQVRQLLQHIFTLFHKIPARRWKRWFSLEIWYIDAKKLKLYCSKTCYFPPDEMCLRAAKRQFSSAPLTTSMASRNLSWAASLRDAAAQRSHWRKGGSGRGH